MSGRRTLPPPTVQAAVILAVAGLASFILGVSNGFHDDDFPQIVNNVPVHSIANIGLFFQGSTFYAGQGLAPLTGTYYRPLMTTLFSLVYTIFGAEPAPFHIVQYALAIGGAFLLYLVFTRCGLRHPVALVLAAVFLVHPINSQVAFALPWMQDTLFFFFGMLAFWLLLRFRSRRSLAGVALALFLALLSKETALLFVVMALIYLAEWNRSRLIPFLVIIAVPLLAWVLLRTHAVGLFVANAGIGPIDRASLGTRLLTMPAIMFLYLSKLVWPLHLASSYYWVHEDVTVQDVVVPLAIDLAVIAGALWVGIAIQRRATRAMSRTYWFFSVWAGLGVAAYLQLVPLDATANEVWFHFAMAGLLGMVGIAAAQWGSRLRVNRRVAVAVASALIVALGFGTALRGIVWGRPFDLAGQDIANSPDDWSGYSDLAYAYLTSGDCDHAISNELASIAIFPTGRNYYYLGRAYMGSGRYPEAAAALMTGARYDNEQDIADSFAQLSSVYGDPNASRAVIVAELQVFPTDSTLWTFLAYLDYTHGGVQTARQEIVEAVATAPANATVAELNVLMQNGTELPKFTLPRCGGA